MEASIVISAKDNFSQTILTLRNSSAKFNKDLEGLTSKLDALDKTKHTIKLDLDKAKRELKETEKAFRSTDEAAWDDTALREAEEKYDNLRRQFAAVGKQARQTEKEILNMSDASSRASNRAFGPSPSGGGGTLSALSKAGIGAMAGNALGQLANAGISSAFGDAAGNMVSSTLSGAITGGAMGSIAGPMGTVVGGLVGGISGAVSAAAQNLTKEDDAFKSYTNDQYQRITEQRKSDLQTGSAIAAERENDRPWRERPRAPDRRDDTARFWIQQKCGPSCAASRSQRRLCSFGQRQEAASKKGPQRRFRGLPPAWLGASFPGYHCIFAQHSFFKSSRIRSAMRARNSLLVGLPRSDWIV